MSNQIMEMSISLNMAETADTQMGSSFSKHNKHGRAVYPVVNNKRCETLTLLWEHLIMDRLIPSSYVATINWLSMNISRHIGVKLAHYIDFNKKSMNWWFIFLIIRYNVCFEYSMHIYPKFYVLVEIWYSTWMHVFVISHKI